MDTSTLLIVAAVLALILFVSVRTRSTMPAVVCTALLALLIFGAFSGLAPAISSGIQGGGDAGAHAVSAVTDATSK